MKIFYVMRIGVSAVKIVAPVAEGFCDHAASFDRSATLFIKP
jgi:hypothetical protein